MEDDDDSWVPLELPIDAPTAAADASTAQSVAVVEATVPDDEAASRSITTLATTTTTTTTTPSIQTLQRRVEMRQHLKRQLVHHPLNLFWSHFLWHLGREFWQLDVQIRLSLILIAIGAVAKMGIWMTWYLWYPRTILLTCLLLGSWLYLDPQGLPRQFQSFFQGLAALPHQIPETLEQLDPQQARIICVVLLFLPTLLQMRTISFLANVNATGGGWMWNGLVTVLLLGVCILPLIPTPTRYNYNNINNTKKTTARDLSQLCLVVLYGTALWITLRQWNLMTMPFLVGPFCLSTGTLLLSYDDHDNMEWFSRMIRQALRLTLRDVLTTVGTSVQEDEMLQLAMLRWIVDYWSYTPAAASGQSSSSSTSSSSSQQPNTTPAQTSQLPRQDLQWNELLPMLNVATDQMSQEVHSFQQPSRSASSQSNSSNSSTATPADPSLNNFQSMLASMNVDDRAKPAVAAYRRNVEQFPPTRQLALTVSITRRCPASLVFLWQLLVASMFQSYSTTLCIFVLLLPLMGLEALRIQAWIRACESLSLFLEATEPSNQPSNTPSSSLAEVSGSNSNHDDSERSMLLSNVDPMTILLSGDEDTILTTAVATDTSEGPATNVTTKVTIPTLLIVWRNIQSSVGALEVSLTAARCVNTGAVAVDFAKNIMSLAQFGVEVSQHGWMHGLTVIVKEVIFHQNDDSEGNRPARRASYTHAAVSAVHNGQRLGHNLRVLAVEDNNTHQVLAPIVGFFGFVGGLFQPKQNGEDQENTEGAAEEGAARTDEQDNTKAGEENSSSDTKEACDEKDDGKPTEAKASTPERASSDFGLKEENAKSDTSDEKATKALDKTNDSEKTSWDAITTTTEQPLTQEEEPVEADVAVVVEPQISSTNASILPQNMDKGTEDQSETSSKLNAACKETDVSVKDSVGKIASAIEPSLSRTETKGDVVASAGAILQDSDASKKDEQGCAPEDLGAVMDLIAEAFEKGLIDESEKNAFCLKLSANNESDVVHGMKKTLEGLIQESTSEQVGGPQLGYITQPAEAQAHNRSSSSNDATGDDDAWNPIVPGVASQEELAIQSLDYSDRLAEAVNSADASSGPGLAEREVLAISDGDGIPTVETRNRRRDNEEENMWVKVGGSMAVIGAVVGGAFLAMNHGNENNQPDFSQNANSSVRIERLDEDEEQENADEWETTRDASTQAQ